MTDLEAYYSMCARNAAEAKSFLECYGWQCRAYGALSITLATNNDEEYCSKLEAEWNNKWRDRCIGKQP